MRERESASTAFWTKIGNTPEICSPRRIGSLPQTQGTGVAILASIEVHAVANSRDRKRFLEFPWQLYRDDPYWIPPLRTNQRELVGYKRHPFYEDAEGQTFLATSGGDVVGRVAAIVNRAHNRTFPEDPRGFLGFFESVDDQQVANQLFDAAREWLGQRDMRNLRGPLNPSLNYECGMLVERFDMSPTFMMTYNPPYYSRLWEQYGFVKAQDLFSFIGHKDDLVTLEKKVFFVVQEATRRFKIKVRTNKSQTICEGRSLVPAYL